MFAAPLIAHDFQQTQATLVVRGNQVVVQLVCDLDAYALGVSPQTPSEECRDRLESMELDAREKAWSQAKRFLERRIKLRVDGEPLILQLMPAKAPGDQGYFGVKAELVGALPEDWREFTLFSSRALPPLMLEVFIDDKITYKGLVGQGLESPPIGRGSTRQLQVFYYLTMGYMHILPLGLDHILFVLGLFLFSRKPKDLLWQVSAFTLAHTTTLALSAYGVVRLPSQLVESLIALSLVYVGVENLLATQIKTRRLLVVFGFGLLHGLGFASVVMDLDSWQRGAWHLISFNVGVELGQLSVIGIAFLVFMLFHSELQKHLSNWGSLAVALTGCVLLISRMM
ncbi:MAG: HupE/UreJ family protein [Acidobacteria bacterium]|nr:HupE/UreJ family protein [Acidobacteriota bacterium]